MTSEKTPAKETPAVTVTNKELVEALIKYLGYHDGIWQLTINLGLTATNIQVTMGDTGKTILTPAAFIPINQVGLVKVATENDIAVDAAKVNPSK